jgi:hypothetical protein
MATRVLALVEQPVPREEGAEKAEKTGQKAASIGRPFGDVPET